MEQTPVAIQAPAKLPLPDPQKIREAIKVYAEAGFSLVKLIGKKPIEFNWVNTPYEFPEDALAKFASHTGNFGVVLSRRNLVIDVDVRNFKGDDRPDIRLLKAIHVGNIKSLAPIVKTGGGGLHFYFKLPPNFHVRKLLPEYLGIEFLSYGQQVLGYNCRHPETGNYYVLANNIAIAKAPMAPDELLQLIEDKRAKEDFSDVPSMAYKDDDETMASFVDYLLSAPVAIEGANGDATTYQVACRGKDLALTPMKTLDLMLAHYNPRCIPAWSPEELMVKVKNAYAYANAPAGNARPETQFEKIPQEPTDNDQPTVVYDRGKNHVKLRTLNNVSNYLIDHNHPFRDALIFDVFNINVYVQKPLPWNKEINREWHDDDSVHFRLWLSKEKFETSISNIDNAVLVVAQMKKVHPVVDYLESLKWDGVSRVDKWLIEVTGAEDNPYVRTVSRKLLLQMVERVYHPGCKLDSIVVLEGNQGIGKTRLVEILGGKWFANIHIDPHDKDTVDAMRGAWVIEMAEMEVTKRAETQALKGFITKQTDKVRLAYGHRSQFYPRQCVFIGTINPDATKEYLNDQTGNRRYLPVDIKFVDQKKLKEWRDQLFAEAVTILKKGEDSYITDKVVEKLAKKEQKERQVKDPWVEIISTWIKDKKHIFHTATTVYQFALSGRETQMGVVENRRVVQALKELGFELAIERDKELGKTVRGYRYKGEENV